MTTISVQGVSTFIALYLGDHQVDSRSPLTEVVVVRVVYPHAHHSAEWTAKISAFPCHWGEVESPNPNPPTDPGTSCLVFCISLKTGCVSPWGNALRLVTRCQNLHEIPPGRGTGAHVSSVAGHYSSVFCLVILSVLTQLPVTAYSQASISRDREKPFIALGG